MGTLSLSQAPTTPGQWAFRLTMGGLVAGTGYVLYQGKAAAGDGKERVHGYLSRSKLKVVSKLLRPLSSMTISPSWPLLYACCTRYPVIFANEPMISFLSVMI